MDSERSLVIESGCRCLPPHFTLALGKWVLIICFLAYVLTRFSAGLSDEIALKTYDAMAHHVLQANFNRRVITVSWWSLNKMVGAVLVTLRTMADPVRAHLKEVYGNINQTAEVIQGMPLYA